MTYLPVTKLSPTVTNCHRRAPSTVTKGRCPVRGLLGDGSAGHEIVTKGHTYSDRLRPLSALQLRADALRAELLNPPPLRYALDTGERPLFWRPAGRRGAGSPWPWLGGLLVAFVVLHLVFVS